MAPTITATLSETEASVMMTTSPANQIRRRNPSD